MRNPVQKGLTIIQKITNKLVENAQKDVQNVDPKIIARDAMKALDTY